jgi:hypothetical protein
MHAQPIDDDFESGGRHCLFDIIIFARRPGLGFLKNMVHPGNSLTVAFELFFNASRAGAGFSFAGICTSSDPYSAGTGTDNPAKAGAGS